MKRKWQSMIVAALCCLPFSAEATDLQPWFPDLLLFELGGEFDYRHYHKVDLGADGTTHFSSTDKIFDLSLLVSPYPNWCWEMEFLFASTSTQDFGLSDARITGRYQILDDVAGDAVSLVVGTTLDLATTAALHDVSLFPHGHFNAEAHVSIGKELVNPEAPMYWNWHFWGTTGLGMAEKGRPWFRWDLNVERNFDNFIRLKAFVDGLYGMGSQDLTLARLQHFKGYSTIRHQAVDIGLALTPTFEIWGELSLTVMHRVHARNAPCAVNSIELRYLFPFSL